MNITIASEYLKEVLSRPKICIDMIKAFWILLIILVGSMISIGLSEWFERRKE